MRITIGLVLAVLHLNGQTNMALLSQQDLHGDAYANIWGYVDSAGREYALLTCRTGTAVINITNPLQPIELDYISAPASSWHEIQVWDRYAYVVSEGGRGMQIIYLGQLPDTAYLVKEYTWSGNLTDRAHALQVRDGYAYLTGGSVTSGQTGNSGGLRVLDLKDPENPVSVGTWDSLYVHDCYVRDDTIYAACIFSGSVVILDARNKSSIRPIVGHSYPNGFTHNVALSDDGQLMLTTDETSSPPGMLRIWDISTIRDGIPNHTNITQLGTYGSTGIVHNVYAKGKFAFASYYTEGVRIWDMSEPSVPSLIGHYDSYGADNAANFAGAWGVYPFFPSGNIIVSDISGGLFVMSFGAKEVGIVTGTVTDSTTGQPISDVKLYLIEDSHWYPSDALGNFQLRSISGRSRIKLVRDGYQTRYQDVVIPVNGTSNVNFQLTPAPVEDAVITISIALYQNPAVANHGDFVVVSDAALTATPDMWLLNNGDSLDVPLQPINGSASSFRNSVAFDSTGLYTVYVRGTSISGADTVVSKIYQVAVAKNNTDLAWRSEDGTAVVKVLNAPTGVYFTSLVASGYEVGLAAGARAVLEVSMLADNGVIVRVGDGSESELPTTLLLSRHLATAMLSKSGTYRFDQRESSLTTRVQGFALRPNFPNPFNPTTEIEFDLEKEGRVTLAVYNLLGQRVRLLEDGSRRPGRYRVRWDSRDARGGRVASGVYIYRLQQGGQSVSRKMVLLK